MNLRRHILKLITAASLMLLGLQAIAQTFPSKPITILIGSTAGSTTDGLARAIGQEITLATGQPVIVESRAGAGGGIAAQAAARATPDGYTVFITTNSTQAANPHLFKKLAYDPVRDFAPVSGLVRGHMLMVVHPSVKANTVAEFIALAKQNPNKLSFAEGSSSARVGSELFKQLSGVQLTHVPYKTNPQAVIDLVGGQTDMMIADFTTTLPQVKAGKLRALGVTSPKRSPLVPDIPALSESPAALGLAGYDMSHWNALYVPAATPPAIVNRLNELMKMALAKESVKRFATQNGIEPFYTSPAELGAFQAIEVERWGRIIKAAGIQPE